MRLRKSCRTLHVVFKILPVFFLLSCGSKGPLVEYCMVHVEKETVDGVTEVKKVEFVCHTKNGENVVREPLAAENYICLPPNDITALLRYCGRP